MLDVLLQMAFLVVCGVVWRVAKPGDLDVDQIRQALTGLVYYLLLPALVLNVLWQAPLSLDAPRVALSAASGVIGGLLLSWAICRKQKMPHTMVGAVMLAAAFPNATYLGLPVLEAVLGPSMGRSVAIQYDLFACTPLLLTVGLSVARYYGTSTTPMHPAAAIVKTPPLLAAVLAVVLNLAGVPLPDVIHNWLGLMAGAVSPLMLIALGMSLRWDTLRIAHAWPILIVSVIQLVLMPIWVGLAALLFGLSGNTLAGVVLEAAMPSMVLGIVICDRYGLDTSLYAAAVTSTTALSFVTLPLWFSVLS
ncbi:MAG: AEC family transporter [Gammaproteobacteria bacterium]|nr:AEC family transporter [Gammaproteobacteria bacterium]